MFKIGFVSLVFLSAPTALDNVNLFHMEVVPHGAIQTEQVIAVDEKELDCLAKNIYHEARGEDETGRKAVAQVVLNRVASKRYPNTVCEVVYQVTKHYKTKRKTPQFSWTLDGRSDAINEKDVYVGIVELAKGILQHGVETNVAKSLLYHTTAVNPAWSKSKKIRIEATVGVHIFYAYNK